MTVGDNGMVIITRVDICYDGVCCGRFLASHTVYKNSRVSVSTLKDGEGEHNILIQYSVLITCSSVHVRALHVGFIVTAAVVVVKDGGDIQGCVYKLLEVDICFWKVDGWLQ